MRMIVLMLALLGASCTTAPSASTTQAGRTSSPPTESAMCSTYVGRVVDARDIDTVMQPFEFIGPKGDYETTAAYQARQAAAVILLGAELILLKPSEGRRYVQYDADQQLLRVKSFALDNTQLDGLALFGYGAPYEGLAEVRFSNYAVVLSQDEEVVGGYEATTAFGTRMTVVKVRRTTRGVFDRAARLSAESLFPSADRSADSVAMELRLDTTTAQRLIPAIRFAYLVRPRAPYYLSVEDDYPSPATLQDPREVTNSVSAILGDLQCAFVLDESNAILAATATR